MAIWYRRLPFTQHGRMTIRNLHRAIPWVEELEARCVLATMGPLPSSAFLLNQPGNAATTPALTQQTPSAQQTPLTQQTPSAQQTPSSPSPTVVAPATGGNQVNLTNGTGGTQVNLVTARALTRST